MSHSKRIAKKFRSSKTGELASSVLVALGQRGEPIAEIVPVETQLVASLEIPPMQRDEVYEGLEVETRLSGLDSWRSPSLHGNILRVSPDLKVAPTGDRLSGLGAFTSLGSQ